ncbi:MAG: hypothetical protein ABS46_03165 [Cytophagaceae bacterium SCN 52-12]|nr:MAG: hypothetical protein ABS46_03165 [Cytophagaceae bacterium SCN 52-12]
MKRETFNRAGVKLYILAALSFIAFGFATVAGLDSYEVFLNDKLILKNHVNEPLDLRKLQLQSASDQDRLKIQYRHCTNKGVGTGRSLTIKDQKGNILKKWEFADGSSSGPAMVIPVKILRELENQSGGNELSLYYTAQELPKGEMLASLRF